jgi:HK97 family phage major capsid protein
MIKVSDELCRIPSSNPDYIATEFARRVGAAEEEAFLTGDGLAKPTGLLNATGGANVGVTTAGTSFTADELLDLVHAIKK